MSHYSLSRSDYENKNILNITKVIQKSLILFIIRDQPGIDTKVPDPDHHHQRSARRSMLWTALLSVLTYFVPLIIYLIQELTSDRLHPYRGENYTFRDYICEVLLQAISRALHLVAHLLNDLAQPLLVLVNTDQQTTWQTILILAQQMMLFHLLNLAAVAYFLPLETAATLIRSLQQRS